MRDIGLDYLKHACRRNFGPFRRNEIVLLRFNLKVVSKWGLEADIVERGNLVAVLDFARIKNRPLSELCNRVTTLFILLILLNSHLSVTLKGEEVAFRGLKTNRRTECHWLLGVAILKVQ